MNNSLFIDYRCVPSLAFQGQTLFFLSHRFYWGYIYVWKSLNHFKWSDFCSDKLLVKPVLRGSDFCKRWVNSVKIVDLSFWVDLACFQSVKTHYNTQKVAFPCDAGQCLHCGRKGLVLFPRMILCDQISCVRIYLKIFLEDLVKMHIIHTILIDYIYVFWFYLQLGATYHSFIISIKIIFMNSTQN